MNNINNIIEKTIRKCLNCFKFIIINKNNNTIEQKIRKCLKTAKIALNS